MLYRPRKPVGTSPFMLFCIAVWEYLWGGKFPFHDSDTVKVERSEGGYYFHSASPGAAGKSSTPNNLTPFAITSLTGADFYVAGQLSGIQWDKTSNRAVAFVGGQTKIAKAVPHRRSITLETIDTIKITYRDALAGTPIDGFNDNNRIANDGQTDETQVLYPRFMALNDPGGGFLDTGLGFNGVTLNAQCIIFAMKVEGGTGVFDTSIDPPEQVQWLEVSPLRVWAKRFNA